MNETSHHTSGTSQELDDVIAAYLEACHVGGTPNHAEWLARYPNLADGLAEFFADEDHVAAALRTPVLAATEDFLPSTRDYPGAERPRNTTGPLVLHPAESRREPVGRRMVLAGRYRIFDCMAGGMGVVYLADDLQWVDRGYELKRALKTVRDFEEWRELREIHGRAASKTEYAELCERFRREALSWVRLGTHPNIIQAMAVIDVGAKPYLVMEYADSGDLAAWIAQGRLPVPLAVNFALQFCEGMRHAVQTAGMVHRDIKPANVLIKNDRFLKISDFGLARAFRSDEEPDGCGPDSLGDRLTQHGLGTSAYMSPEQWVRAADADTRSDIFSFGVMLHEMLTGPHLFTQANGFAVRQPSLPLTHDVNPEVPPALSTVIARCLRYRAAERYNSFDDLFSDLADVNSGLDDRLEIVHDPRSIPAEAMTPSLNAVGGAYSLISLGRPAEAVRRAEEGILLDGEDPAHWINQGKALLDLGRHAEARDCFAQAIKLDPSNARAWSNLGWALSETGAIGEAIAAAERAIGLNGRFSEGWMCLGSCLRQVGRQEEAIRTLQTCVDLAPHDWRGQANLGFCLLETNRLTKARDALQRAIEINPDAIVCWNELAWAHLLLGSWRDGLLVADRALELNACEGSAWAVRAWCLWIGRGDKASAMENLNRAVALDPESSHVRAVRRILRGESSGTGVMP